MSAAVAVAIVFSVILVLCVAACAINGCIRSDEAAQQRNGGPQPGQKDGEMVVVDGGQVAEAVVQIQPSCCCGGGSGGGDGGGCGGCGGD